MAQIILQLQLQKVLIITNTLTIKHYNKC